MIFARQNNIEFNLIQKIYVSIKYVYIYDLCKKMKTDF